MKRYFFTISLFLFCFHFVFSQSKTVVVGDISEVKTGKRIENVHVKLLKQNIVGYSNDRGEYSITFYQKERATLVFSHIGFETVYEPVILTDDTIRLSVKLKKKVTSIPIVNIEDEGQPIVVFKSAKISISDYEFCDDKFIFLGYNKRLNKDSEIYLVDENETILGKHFVPGTPVELYEDYLGNVNLLCKNAVYRVGVNKNRLSLYELPLDHFNQLIKPIVDTLQENLIFSDFLHQFPRFKYYAFSPKDTSVNVIKEVVHKEMDWQYSYEYYSLTNADKQFAKRMAKRFKGLDKYDIAASMTGFANNICYEEVYAPLFVINDTINIFDHHEDKIWKFIRDTVEVGVVPFSYHHPRKRNEWKNKLIMDEVTGKIYGLYLRNGYNYLKEINSSTGKIISETKLTFQFVDEIKIKDGQVFYTYKPRQSLQKKFLYKELLN